MKQLNSFIKNFLRNKKAFTFVELMVVILIISLVTTVAVASISVIRRSARDKKLLNNVLEFQTALESYRLIESSYPSSSLVVSGNQLVGSSSGAVFYDSIPDNILYYYDEVNDKYKLSFELEGPLDDLTSGFKCAITNDLVDQACCPSGLLAHWNGDGNANDSLGNYNGTFTNAAYTIGKFGQAFNFNGTSGYITLSSPVSFSIGRTISFWINLNSVSTTRYFLGDTSRPVGARYSGTEFLAFQGGTGYTFIPWTKVNKFVNLTIVKIDDYNFDFYIDGSKIGTSYSGNNSASILIDLIGRRSDGYYFLGPIDDIMIFDRTLSSTEIKMLAEGKNTCYSPR